MKKGIIIYKSKYGATEKYANWLSKETNFDCIINKSIDINKKVSAKSTKCLLTG